MKKKAARDDELSKKPKIKEQLLKIFRDVEKAYTDQNERVDDTIDYWDAYNCKFGPRQFYSGNSRIYVPLVKAAIEARKTRFTNQIFPQAGRYVDVVTENGDRPEATMALMEHYVRRGKFRTEIVPALCIQGDVEGQYSVYVSWKKTTRHVVSRETKPVTVKVNDQPMEIPEAGEIETMKKEELEDGCPDVELIADADLVVLPATVDSIDDALEIGGAVSVIRRWTKGQIRKMKAEGEIEEDSADTLLEFLGKVEKEGMKDTAKELASAAGIRSGRGGCFAQVYEVWTRIEVDGDLRLTRSYYGGDEIILGCKLNPYWCDRCPVISGPVVKSPGVFKGRSRVADVLDLQVFANDTMNEAADTAHFSAMPIIMTDPIKNPRVNTMILGLAAVWETDPNSTKFAEFPPLWKDCFERIQAIKSGIFEVLGVNPSMLPQQTGTKAGSKRNQAEIAMEQQVDLLTTADAVTNIEECILTPVLQRFAEYDHQFRDEDITIQSYGEFGMSVKMEEIPPQQMNRRWEIRWFGVEAARNAQQMQQQIGLVNVIKGIPPQMYAGYKLSLGPALAQAIENAFGPRLGRLTFRDMKAELSKDPQVENEMMQQGLAVTVSPLDNDAQHLQVHMPLMQMGDPSGNIRVHIAQHQQALQAKAMSAAQQAGGQPPGGGGGPQPGAAPGQPHAAKGPPGQIHQDRMPAAGAMTMPRKT